MSSVNYIYSLTSVVAFLRCEQIAPTLTEVLLQNLSLTFGGKPESIYDGSYLYKTYKLNSNLNQTQGFTNSQWVNLENLINGNQQSKIGISSLIYCFLTYPNIENKYKEYYINKLYSNIYNGNPPKYFYISEIESLINSFSISEINLEIESSEAKTDSKAVNYNYYNSLPLFATLDSDSNLKQLIKDSENQYYYLSGEISYDLDINTVECEKSDITITTPTGDIVTTVYRNFPCFEQDSFVGPVSGIKFLRFFNDGPPSSGYFESDVLESYIKFDENISNKKDYSSNNKILFSFTKDSSGNYVILKSGVQVDAQGPFSSTGEYGLYYTNAIYSDEGCDWMKEELESLPLMRMHQGDNLPKYYYFKNKVGQDCVTGKSGPHNWTGFKFVNFELKDSWSAYFDFINTNPRDDKSRILKRALNIENFYDSQNLIIHSPYLNVSSEGNDTLICADYVGYPQLNSNYSSLPGFAFYQTFDNENFGTGNSEEFSSISIHPAISSGLSPMINSRSNRNIKVSNFSIFSGVKNTHDSFLNTTKLNINKTFNSSSIAEYDEVFKKSMAIGDNFNNEVSGSSSLQYNAGYFYTGYNLLKNGEPVDLFLLLSEYSDKKIGAKYSKIKYISGYKESGTNNTYPVIALTAHAPSGDLSQGIKSPGEYIVYYYLNTDTGINSINAVNTGWIGNFAPIPQGVIDNPNKYSGIYNYQKVENYFPRYYSGPFASYDKKFLYPNANYIYEKYSSSVNGFPYKISYVINIREETAREFYLSSGINGTFNYENIVRAKDQNTDDYTGLGIKMITPFTPNTNSTQIKNKYDYSKNTGLYNFPGEFFKQADFSEDLVNSFYVPSTSGCIQRKLNSTIYKQSHKSTTPVRDSVNLFYGPFSNGIGLTGEIFNREIYIGKNNAKTTIYNVEPRSEGLFWGYEGKILSGDLLYTPPIFDLSLFTKYVNKNMSLSFTGLNKIPSYVNYDLTKATYSNNGFINNQSLYEKTSKLFQGRDPIFYEYIGGRIGEGAELDGGYHSKNIIGDNWYNFYVENFGFSQAFCDTDAFNNERNPNFDKYLLLFSLTSGSLDIFTKGLNFYPYYLNNYYLPFKNQSLDSIGVNTNYIKLENEYYYTFNLKDHFPLKNVASEQLYLYSGLTIGPFNQDVEFCVKSGNYIIPSGNLIVDDQILSTTGFLSSDQAIICENVLYTDIVNRFKITSGIIPGVGNRGKVITTFKLIPSGQTVIINISGNNKIGFEKDAIVTIRPRTVLGGVDPYNIANPILSGDINTLNCFNYINNNSEQKFSFPTNGNFESLVGKKFEYVTNPRIDLLFPLPDVNDFDTILNSENLIEYDSFGNKIYKSKKGPTYDYWRIKNPSIRASGIRDVSRVSFEIASIKLEYGEIPYQSHKIIIPSGNCSISGIFAYTGQAESAILSQGLFLTGMVRPSALETYYSPHYVSDVLKRLPSGVEVLPSGSGKYVVLDAPSYAKKRKNYFNINEQSEYENYSPEGLNYNKFIWPALSDLAELNPDIVYEQLPPEDDNTFINSYLFFSASQGQVLSSGISGLQNPNENATYKTQYLYALVDSTSTNSSYNTGKCIIKANGQIDTLNSGNLSGILTSDGITLGLIKSFSNL